MLRLLTRIQSLDVILALMCPSKASNQTVACARKPDPPVCCPSHLLCMDLVEALCILLYTTFKKYLSCYKWCLSMKIIVGHSFSDVAPPFVTVTMIKKGSAEASSGVEPTEPGSFHQNFMTQTFGHWPEFDGTVWAVPECTICRRCRSTCEKHPGVCVLPASYMKLCYCTITVALFTTSVLIFASHLSLQSLLFCLCFNKR